MSLAKKSTKWLVALLVIFAFVLTVVFAAGNVAGASAEPVADVDVDSIVIIEATDTIGDAPGDAYPDLTPTNGTRTITANYFVEIPAAAVEGEYSIMKFAPTLTYPSGKVVRPNTIVLNNAFTDYVTLEYVSGNNEGYLDNVATAFSVALKSGAKSGYVNGVTGGAADSGKYLFTATYVLSYEENETAYGAYELGFGADTEIASESEGNIYIPTIENPYFNIRALIDVPVAVSGLIFNNEQQTGVVDKDGYAFVIGDLEIDLYPISYHDQTPAGFSLVAETYVGGINAGAYQGTFELDDRDTTMWRIPDGNDGYTYSTDNYTVNWEIAKRSITVPVSAGTIYTYNGQPQSFEFSEDPLTDAAYITITGTPQTNVGEYTVTAALTYPANTYWGEDDTDTADKEYEFVINPALITVPTPADVTYTFNKTAQSFQWADTPDALITITGTPQTNAGNYTVTASIPENYAWNDEGHTTADKTFPFVIVKKSVTVPSLDASHFTYDGQEKSVALVQADADEGYIAERTTGTTWSATNAGDYAVKVGLEYPDDTYWGNDTTDTADKTLNWDIAKVQITKPTPLDNVQYVYDSYNKQFMLDVVSAETGYYTISNNIRRNAGTQTVTVSLNDKSNTQWADGTTADLEFSFTVQRRPVNVSVTADAASHVYGDTPADVSISMTGAIDAFSCSYKVICVDGEAPYAEYNPTQFDAGLNVGHYTLNPIYNDINGNYDVTVSEPFSYEVIKREITIPTAISGLEYTGSAQVGVTKTDASYYDLYSGYDERTAPGEYIATYRLKSTTNSYWAGDETDVADKTVEWSIAKKSITKPEISVVYKTYNGESQSNSGSGTGYTFTGSGTNAGSYPVTVTLSDKDNTEWNDGTTADYEEADKLVINKKSVTISITKTASSSVYHDAVATITVNATGIVNEGDLGTISYQAKYSIGSGYQYYTKAEFESTDPYPIVSNYILEPTYTANDNYTVNASSSPYEITTRYITVPTVREDTYLYDGDPHSIEFEGVDADYVDVASVSESAIGTYPVAVSLKAQYAGNIAWNEAGYPTEAKNFTLTIEVVNVHVTFVGVFNDVEKTLAENVELHVFEALPTYTIRWFKSAGYTFNNETVTTATLAMDNGTVRATYIYNVGAGDVDGNSVISSADVLLLKRWNVGLDRAKKVNDAADAWAKADDENFLSGVLCSALDANSNGSVRSNDVVAVREALATGHAYKVIVREGITQVAKVDRVTVTNYADLLANIALGNPVTLGNDIGAANEIFNVDSAIPVDIDLGAKRLTVKGFTLNTATAGATLKITNGTLYTVTGITVTAPNGNVVVSDVNGYSYDGTTVNLAAYSESLHIEKNVAFYIYKAQDPATNEDYADVDAFVADVYPENIEQATTQEITALNTTITTLATTRIGETEARMADIAAIKADTEKTEGQKATEINALDVKKAILEVPIDTHVVVEAAAKLSAEKIVVKAQSDETAPAVTTFAIEVKNAEAEVVTVDISEVKDNTGDETVYVVSEVAISGASSQVEVVSGDNTDANVKKYVAQIGTTSYETLQAAINAAQNADTIKLIADVTDGTGLMIPDNTAKSITIDFNGKTYTVIGSAVGSTGTESQAMHWSNNSTVTLKNGSFVVAAGATGVKMAMQNYSALTVKNMTMDFSNITVRNYGDYTGTIYEAYTGLEISLFNINAGSLNMEGSTITMPANSTKGICISVAGATIANSTINGAVSLNSEDAEPSVTVTESTITKGVVPYFAADAVAENNGVWTIADAVEVYNAAELTEALAAGAKKIIVMDDISSTNGFLVASDAKIDLNNHTVTVETGANVNNRAFKVTNGTLEIYNGEIIAQGEGTTSSNGKGCYGSFRAEVGTKLIAHDLTLRNSRPWGLNIKLLGARAELTNVDIISAYGGGIEVTDDDGADGTVQGYAKMVDCSVTQTGYFDHCSSAVSVSGNSTLDVYSTTYTAETAIYVFSSGGTINVYGGEFTGNRNAIVVASDLNSYPNAACIVNVYDSEINGTFSHSGKACDKINIYGGTFDHDPTAYVAEGYAAVKEGGVWTVIPATIVMNEAELNAAVAANADYIIIGDDFSLANTVSLNGGKDITIDMNGHTITSPDKFGFGVNPGNSLEFTGSGSVVYSGTRTGRSPLWIEGSQDPTAVDQTHLTIGEDVTIVSSGKGLIIYQSDSSSYCYGVVVTVKGTITSAGSTIWPLGKIAQHDGDVVNGTPIDSVLKINIEGTASLTATGSDASAVTGAGFANMVIKSGAELTGGGCAVYIKSGFITIEDGVVLTSTKATYTAYSYKGSGANPTGDGILIDNCYYPGNNAVVTLGANLEDTITVTAEGAQKIATYWAVKSEAELNEAIAAKAPYIFIRDSFTATNTILIDYSLTINGNNKTITATGEGSGYAIYVMYEAEGGVAVNIKDLTLKSTGRQVAFMTNCDYASTATLTNVDITCDGECIYSNGLMTVTATGCNFTHDGIYAEGKDAVYYSALIVGYAGAIVAENCTVTSFGNGASTFPSGGTITLRNTDITISESASSNENAGYALWARNEDYTNLPGYNCDSVINVYSGTITGEFKLTDKYTGTDSKNVYAPIINIYGGTFDHDPTDYVAAGYGITEADGIYTVAALEGAAAIGHVAYETFDAAVAAAQDGDTIVLLADVTYGTERVVPVWEIKAFNIDLNGKTFTTNSNQGITLSNNGYGASAICYGDNENTSPARNIKVSNGTIRTAYGAGLYFDAAVTATLENLTVAQNYPANVQSTDEYSTAVRLTSGATVNIYSGTYSGKNAVVISNSGGYANIYGGDFRGALYINGGASSKKVLTIYGGTFDHDPTAYVADGYVATENEGVWTVAAE